LKNSVVFSWFGKLAPLPSMSIGKKQLYSQTSCEICATLLYFQSNTKVKSVAHFLLKKVEAPCSALPKEHNKKNT